MLNLTNFGSMPLDGSHLLIDTQEEYEKAMGDPIAAKYVRPFRMGRELINGLDRWCLWLADAEPGDLRKSKYIASRLESVRAFRLQSSRKVTCERAGTPWLFGENHQPDDTYLAIPSVFSDRREYMTCDFYSSDIIAGNKIFTCIDPDGFNFAIAESSMTLAWQKAIGGRLGIGCNFSNTVVWNTLPLPQLDGDLRRRIIDAGQRVLTARRNHPGASLADLYDPLVMPADLREAHRSLDELVDVAFGAEKPCVSEAERLQVLFDSYEFLLKGSVPFTRPRRFRGKDGVPLTVYGTYTHVIPGAVSK